MYIEIRNILSFPLFVITLSLFCYLIIALLRRCTEKRLERVVESHQKIFFIVFLNWHHELFLRRFTLFNSTWWITAAEIPDQRSCFRMYIKESFRLFFSVLFNFTNKNTCIRWIRLVPYCRTKHRNNVILK